MKNDIKKLSPYDIAMIGNLFPLTERKVRDILVDKGDIEMPPLKNSRNPIKWIPLRDALLDDFVDSFEMPNGKSMKAADRRKRTYHKHQQRERQYRNLGYPLERFSSADIGKMREGVGMFPETQHQYSMYNSMRLNGSKKKEKPISTQQAMEMMEEERLLDEQDAQKEYEEAERLFMMDEMENLMQDVYWFDNHIEYTRGHIASLMERVNELTLSIDFMRNKRCDCLEKIEKMQEVLNK